MLLTACAAVVLTGCTSFEGAPRPVIGLRQNLAMLDNYKIPAAIEDFDALAGPKPDEAVRYRNKVMAIYMNAMDAQYALFRRKLNDQRKGTNLGLDLATLGLTGAVPLVASGAKDVLGALANAATSSRTAIDKELYFEQTLPALLAAMDAERDDAKANLITNMSKSAAEYPMAVAFTDLSSYEASASFERAADKLTAAASADRAKANAKLENAVAGCNVNEDLSTPRGRIFGYVVSEKATAEVLSKMALRVGAPTTRDGKPLTVQEQRDAIQDKLLNGPCDLTTLNLIASDFATYTKPNGANQ